MQKLFTKNTAIYDKCLSNHGLSKKISNNFIWTVVYKTYLTLWDGTRLMWHYIYAVYTNKQIQCYTCCMKLKITASCESIFFLFGPFSLFMSLWDITGVSSPFYFKVCNMTSHGHLEVFGTELFESHHTNWNW